MLNPAESFTAPILQHPRFVLWAPALIVAGGVVLGNVAWFVARGLNLSRGVGSGVAVLCFVVAIPLAIWIAKSHRGEIEIDGNELVTRTKGQSERRIHLDKASWTPHIWQRGITQMNVGVIVIIEDGTSRLSIGASDPGLISSPLVREAEVTTIPPNLRIPGEALRHLLERLQTTAQSAAG